MTTTTTPTRAATPTTTTLIVSTGQYETCATKIQVKHTTERGLMRRGRQLAEELVNDDDIVLQDLLGGNYSLPLKYYYAIGNFGYGTTGIRFQSKSARNEFVAFGVADLRRAVTLSVAKKYGITRDM